MLKLYLVIYETSSNNSCQKLFSLRDNIKSQYLTLTAKLYNIELGINLEQNLN